MSASDGDGDGPVPTVTVSIPVTTSPTMPTVPTSGTQITLICTSVSSTVDGPPVTEVLPSTYGISCTSPVTVTTADPVPVTIVIETTSGAESLDGYVEDVGGVQELVATPEPSSIALIGTGLLGIAGVMRRRIT